MNVAGDVDWADEATDPPRDVRDNSGNLATDREDVDILSVRVKPVGTDLNVTLTLAGGYNATAEYAIDLLADETTAYQLAWKTRFSAAGPGGLVITVTGYISLDGKTMSWIVAKSSFTATSTFRVQKAEAKLAIPGALMYTDTVEGTPPSPEEVQIPKSIKVRVLFDELHRRNVTVTVTYEGANATAVREKLDLDADGVVSPTEATAYTTTVKQRIAQETSLTNGTLDGKKATQVSYGFELQGAEGNVLGSTPVQFLMMQTLVFAPPETKSIHVYIFDHGEGVGGDEPWDNEFSRDTPWGDEFIGGDEPWENTFIGGEDPWGEEAVGGDEPWDNKVDVIFRVEAPTGWRFVTRDWPSGMSDHVESDGSVLDMDASATHSSYATTMGKLNKLTLEEVKEDDDGGFIPGLGAPLALTSMALLVTVLLARRRR